MSITFTLVAEKDLREALNEAFDAFQRSACESAVIRFPDSIAPSREIVAPILEALDRVPALRALTLVHSNALLGFLVSSIGLQYPRVRIAYARP